MAEKLSIQIALDGGADIERQLAGIGEAGTKAFADITKSAEQAGGFKQLDPKDVTAKLQEMGVTGADSIKKIQDAVASAGKLETVVAGITSVETAFSALAKAAPLVGAALVAAFVVAVKAANAFADAVNKVSDEAAKLGVSIEKLDQFRASLERAGISAQGISAVLAQIKNNADKISLDQVQRDAAAVREALKGDFSVGGTDQFKRLTNTANEFTNAGRAAREQLAAMGQGIPGTTRKDVEELGTELAKLKGLGIDIKVSDDAVTQAQKIIEFLAKMPDKEKAAQIAMQHLGDAGPELVAGFRTGSITLDQFRERLGTLTAEQEAAANKMRQSTNQMSADWERFKANIGAPIAIAGMAAITAVFDAIKGGIATTVQEFVAVGRAINAVASVGAGVIGAMVAPINMVISAVSQLGSAIGGITWDAISAAGVAAWNAIVSSVESAGSAIATFASSLGGIVWDAISAAGVAAWNALVTAVTDAGSAIATFASSLPSIAWDAISAAGVAAWNALIGVIQQAGSAVTTFVSSLGTIVWDAISGAGVAAWNAVTTAIGDATTAVLNFFSNLASGAWDKVKQLVGLGGGSAAPAAAGGMARGGLLGGRGTGTSDSNLAWLSRGEYIIPAWAVRQPGVLAFLEALRKSGRIPGFAEGGAVGGLIGSLGGALRGVWSTLKSAVDALNSAMEPLHDALASVMDKLAQSIGSALNALNDGIGSIESSLGNSMNSVAKTIIRAMESLSDIIEKVEAAAAKMDEPKSKAKGKARGGLLGGRGTGTSDSNLAWVSRGEHIMPAHAVRQPGVLAFLEALRRSGGDLSRVLDGMGRFALGGMVPRAIPAFATGGLAGGMSNVTIQFPGLPAISGLRASSDVVDQLHKAAALAQVRSGGRKPSRYS